MEQILLTYGLLKETVSAIMILYKNTQVKFRLPDGDTDFLDIGTCVLQGDTLATYLFIICPDYVLYRFHEKKKTVSSWQRKETEDTPHMLFRTWTTPMT